MIHVEAATVVIETSLRVSVALAAILAARRALAGRTSASRRRALLLAGVLTVPLVPAAGVVLPDLVLGWPAAPELGALPTGAPVEPGGFADGFGWLHGVAAVWGVGAAVMMVRLTTGLIAAGRRIRAARPLRDRAWLESRDAIAAELGMSRLPELRVAESETVPLAAGVARRVVLVPPSALAWSAARRRAVLAHEMGHLARHEPLARIAAEIVRAIHWFDPLLRMAVARFRRESELAADEAALAFGIAPDEYAGHLVGLARSGLEASPGRAVAAMASGELGERVEAILDPRRHAMATRRVTGSRCVGAATLALVLATGVPRFGTDLSLAADLAARHDIARGLANEILVAAEREGVDRAVAFGLVAEESGFDPERVSRRGAVGLTQVLPATARSVDPDVTADELRDVRLNLRVGLRYLRRQIDREGGDVARGLLAYALGPRRLDELRRSGDPLSFDYPARVLAHTD